MVGGEVAPGHQLLRQPGQFPSGALIDAGEARHDIAQQKRRDDQADDAEDGGVDQRADNAAAHAVEASAILEIAPEGFGQVRGPLGRAHEADVQDGKMLGLLFEREREALALA